MFTYRCLRCGKQHSNNGTFEQSFETNCLRCGATFSVTADTISTAGDKALTGSRSQAITKAPRGGNNSVPTEEPATASSSEAITTQPVEAIATGTESLADMELLLPHSEEENGEAYPVPAPRPSSPAVAVKKDRPEKAAKTTSLGPAPKKRLVLMAQILVPVLLVFGIGSWFLFGRSAPAKKEAAKSNKTKSKTTAKKTTPAKTETKAEQPKQPPPAAARVAAFRLSAVRLSAELAADPEGTNRKYKDALVEVSGILDRIGPPRGSKTKSVTYAFFQTNRAIIACEMSSMKADPARRRNLTAGNLWTVLGVYQKDGNLVQSELLDVSATADERYRGKAIEIVGLTELVETPGPNEDRFPSVTLEGDTDSSLQVRCLFRKALVDEVKLLRPGVRVTIRGECNGRFFDKGKCYVQLDNSRLVDTTGPESAVPRVAARDLGRAYEEDLRPYYVPPRGTEAKFEPPVTVIQLSKELKADVQNLEKYRHQIITVSGRLAQKYPPNVVIMDSGATDHLLKVCCRFSKEIFPNLADSPDFRVSGFCTGLDGQGVVRLENCEVDASQLLLGVPRLTAEFLPHRPGTVLTYDVARFPPLLKSALVIRQTWLQQEGGIIETVVTHSGPLLFAKSLFPPEKPENWLAYRKTKKARLPGPVYQWKVSAGFVSIGRRIARTRTTYETIWEPVLKLGAKTGDSWDWTNSSVKHVYTVDKFALFRGRRSVVVREALVTPLTEARPHEIHHLYVEGIGEVEHQEFERITSIEKKILAEKKLILPEDLPIDPPKDVRDKKTGDEKAAPAKKPEK